MRKEWSGIIHFTKVASITHPSANLLCPSTNLGGFFLFRTFEFSRDQPQIVANLNVFRCCAPKKSNKKSKNTGLPPWWLSLRSTTCQGYKVTFRTLPNFKAEHLTPENGSPWKFQPMLFVKISINLIYPSKLQPSSWPSKKNGVHRFLRVPNSYLSMPIGWYVCHYLPINLP